MKPIYPNGLPPILQTLITFVFALLAAIICARLTARFVFNNSLNEFYLLCVPWIAYWLIAGAYANGPQVHSVQGILGIPSWWVFINGLSWGIPRPFGWAIFKTSIAPRSTDMTGDAAIAEVTTRDGAQNRVGVVLQWRVRNARLAGQYSPAELEQRVKDIEDYGVRQFALLRESDGDTPNALTQSKGDFSRFLACDPTLTEIRMYRPDGTEAVPIENTHLDQDNQDSMAAKFLLLGVDPITAEVKDVDPPQEVKDSRNAAAAEDGQVVQERKDTTTLRNEILFLMWGTDDPAEISRLEADGGKPLMSELDAREAVRTKRGDVTHIHITGDGGDFTKAEALRGHKGTDKGSRS